MKAMIILQMEKLTWKLLTGPKQWLNVLHTASPQHLSDPSSLPPSEYSCSITVHVKRTRSPQFIWTVWRKIQYIVKIFSLPSFFPLPSAERFGSLTLSHGAIFLLTLLISNSCREPLCEGIVSFCAHSIPAFLLNCQQHQLVPHVVLVCTVLAVAKCFLCGQHANWPTDNFLGVSLGEKFKYLSKISVILFPVVSTFLSKKYKETQSVPKEKISFKNSEMKQNQKKESYNTELRSIQEREMYLEF